MDWYKNKGDRILSIRPLLEGSNLVFIGESDASPPEKRHDNNLSVFFLEILRTSVCNGHPCLSRRIVFRNNGNVSVRSVSNWVFSLFTFWSVSPSPHHKRFCLPFIGRSIYLYLKRRSTIRLRYRWKVIINRGCHLEFHFKWTEKVNENSDSRHDLWHSIQLSKRKEGKPFKKPETEINISNL